jgi:hypothetical protein
MLCSQTLYDLRRKNFTQNTNHTRYRDPAPFKLCSIQTLQWKSNYCIAITIQALTQVYGEWLWTCLSVNAIGSVYKKSATYETVAGDYASITSHSSGYRCYLLALEMEKQNGKNFVCNCMEIYFAHSLFQISFYLSTTRIIVKRKFNFLEGKVVIVLN